MNEELIAPCGMNCAACSSYLAFVNDVRSKGIRMSYCRGCRARNKMCAFLKKHCALLLEDKVKYCYECPDFPCENLKHLDAGYRKKFRMSMIENLEFIKEHGIAKLLEREIDKWKCPECGEMICCHNGICFNCGLEKLRVKKKLYRWEDD